MVGERRTVGFSRREGGRYHPFASCFEDNHKVCARKEAASASKTVLQPQPLRHTSPQDAANRGTSEDSM